MQTGARARSLASWTRGRALGDGVRRRRIATAKVPDDYTRITAHSVSLGAQSARARCPILIGTSAIRNRRIPLKPHANSFSNRSNKPCLRALFSHVSRSKNHNSPVTSHASRFTNHQSLLTSHAFLIATRPKLEIEPTHSQQKRKHFLIATFSPVLHCRRKFANQEIGVPRKVPWAHDDSQITSRGSRVTDSSTSCWLFAAVGVARNPLRAAGAGIKLSGEGELHYTCMICQGRGSHRQSC
jgi:hypothetical protein